MQELLEDILAEMRENNRLLMEVLGHIEDARVESAKRNCPEMATEQLANIMKMMEGSPLAPILKTMMASKMGGA